jgi:antitoxin FitA
MPVNLSIKLVPDKVASRLRQRAARHRRSLQGELLAIVEAAAASEGAAAPGPAAAAVPRERATQVRAPRPARRNVAPRSEAALMVREDRDGRALTADDVYDRLVALGGGTPAESTQWVRELRSRR